MAIYSAMINFAHGLVVVLHDSGVSYSEIYGYYYAEFVLFGYW